MITGAMMIKPPKAFDDLTYQARIAGHVGFRGFAIFHEAARVVGPTKVQEVIDFLKSLDRSKVTDRDIMSLWMRTNTYVPSQPSAARPLVRHIIDILEHPETPESEPIARAGPPTDL